MYDPIKIIIDKDCRLARIDLFLRLSGTDSAYMVIISARFSSISLMTFYQTTLGVIHERIGGNTI